MATLKLYQSTGLDPAHKNIIDPSVRNDFFSKWASVDSTIDRAIFNDGEQICARVSKDTATRIDYAIVENGGTLYYYFCRLSRIDAYKGLAFFELTRDTLSDYAEISYKCAALTLSTTINADNGGIAIEPVINGFYRVSTPFSGGVAIIAEISDSGALLRGGEHSYVIVKNIPLDEATTVGAIIARTTSIQYTRPGDSDAVTLSVDGVRAVYVIPSALIPEKYPAGVVPAVISSDYPGASLGITDAVFASPYLSLQNEFPEYVIRRTYKSAISNTAGTVFFIGNKGLSVKIPDVGKVNYEVTFSATPAGGVSVSMSVNGVFYDLTPSLKLDAVYTNEDAQTRAIGAVGSLVSSAIGAGSAIASGGAYAVTSGVSIAGQTVATIASGRAYSFTGGGFPASCTIYTGSDTPTIFPGFALIGFSCQNATAREYSLKTVGRSGSVFLSSLILSANGKNPGYYKGTGTPTPYRDELAEILENGVTVWGANGVGVLT